MKNESLHYILTGSTGILGSHILYELMNKIYLNQYKGHLVLFIRSKRDKSIQDRFWEVIDEKVAPDFIKEIDVRRILNENITLIDFDLKERLQDLSIFKAKKSYQLIHCAASVNLGNNAAAFEEIKLNNYLGTLSLIDSTSEYITKISYVSTAFSSGHRNGEIRDQFLQENRNNFRNPYEQFKAQTEEEISKICDAYGIDWQIIRPSIICGRMIDAPFNVIPKFLVFYLFGAFFHRAKQSYGELPIRITMNSDSGLNLIPVDYAAKAVVKALESDLKELNITHGKCVPNIYAVPNMLKKVGWNSYEITSQVPDELNTIEKLYYRTVGVQLNHYLITPQHEFNVEKLDKLMYPIKQPDVQGNYLNLVDFAVEKEFMHVLN